MNMRRIATIAFVGAALLFVGAGFALADDKDDPTEGYPSTQSPTQGADAGTSTLGSSADSFGDAAKGDDRPNGANGTETEFVDPDPRFVEGPLGGLAKNGPLQ